MRHPVGLVVCPADPAVPLPEALTQQMRRLAGIGTVTGLLPQTEGRLLVNTTTQYEAVVTQAIRGHREVGRIDRYVGERDLDEIPSF